MFTYHSDEFGSVNQSDECPLIHSISLLGIYLHVGSPGDSSVSTSELITMDRWKSCPKVGTSSEGHMQPSSS